MVYSERGGFTESLNDGRVDASNIKLLCPTECLTTATSPGPEVGLNSEAVFAVLPTRLDSYLEI